MRCARHSTNDCEHAAGQRAPHHTLYGSCFAAKGPATRTLTESKRRNPRRKRNSREASGFITPYVIRRTSIHFLKDSMRVFVDARPKCPDHYYLPQAAVRVTSLPLQGLVQWKICCDSCQTRGRQGRSDPHASPSTASRASSTRFPTCHANKRKLGLQPHLRRLPPPMRIGWRTAA